MKFNSTLLTGKFISDHFTCAFVQYIVNLLFMMLHLALRYLTSARGTVLENLRLEPSRDTLIMKSVPNVAQQRCHFVLLVKRYQANSAIFDPPKSLGVILNLRHAFFNTHPPFLFSFLVLLLDLPVLIPLVKVHADPANDKQAANDLAQSRMILIEAIE